jgi:hypothetical protein
MLPGCDDPSKEGLDGSATVAEIEGTVTFEFPSSAHVSAATDEILRQIEYFPVPLQRKRQGDVILKLFPHRSRFHFSCHWLWF